MIRCKKCKRQTETGESTGSLDIIEYLDPKGKRIISSQIVCIDCSGEKEGGGK